MDWNSGTKKADESMVSVQRQFTDGTGSAKTLGVGDTIGNYRIHNKIGQGSFGAVFEGQEFERGPKVAIKVETCSSDARCSQLQNEFEAYRSLEGLSGFPLVHYFGKDASSYYLVMDLLGLSLEEMLTIRNRRFCAKTVFIVAKKMIELVERLHKTGRIHRDLKPDNFLIGEDPKELFLIDFGMSKRYIRRDKHIAFTTGKRLTGTPRYASINAHRGCELSRRDDLESIGYIIVYLTKGSLPWQGIKEQNKGKCRAIGEKKEQTVLPDLCCNMPSEGKIQEYFNYVRNLKFESMPNYDYLKGIFDRALYEHGLFDDGILEWEYAFRHSVEPEDEDSFDSMRPKKRKGFLRRLAGVLKHCFRCRHD